MRALRAVANALWRVGDLEPPAGEEFRAPPGKIHHYTYELYALDQKLTLGSGASRADLLEAMDGHILGEGVYLGLFHQ